MDSPASATIQWPPAKKILFRFFCIYFLLYCFPFPVDGFELTTPLTKPYYDFLDWLVPVVGNYLFHIHATPAFPYFDKVDDSGYGLVFLYLLLLLSALITFIWSVADRSRKNYETLNQWLRLYLRYFLVAYLFGYGFIKVFPSQFQEITASRLTMTVGDQSPMLLAWNFMGYSVPLMRLYGMVEVIAGLLLLFRRTTTIGAILSTCTFGYIAVMDFCFNVPVRLLASHLLLMSVFLIIGDSSRLLNVFIFNKPTAAIVHQPLIKRAAWRNIFSGFLIILSLALLYSSIMKGLDAEKSFGRKANKPPLYGVYNTTCFIRNNDTIPPVATDSLRWKQLVIDGGSWNQSGIIKFSDDKRINYNIDNDTLNKTLLFRSSVDTNTVFQFHYTRPDNNLLLLEGSWGKDSIKVLMNKFDLNNFILHREGFKWISH